MRMNSILKKRYAGQSAFTIIELLVVIVIIGILATIIFIFYTGTRTRAIDTSLQADLKSASTQLELDKTSNDLYPSTKEEANGGKGLKPSTGTTFDYIYSAGSNSYCLTATKEDRSYYLDSTNRFPRIGSCQTGSFARTWGGIGSDSTEKIVKTSDGGHAVAGFTSFGAGGIDAYVAKYIADGTLSWNKTWGGAGDDSVNSIIQTSDGGYVIAGFTSSYGAGDDDSFIAKYTNVGALSWSKTWGGTGIDRGISVIQTSDGGYAMTGYTESYGAGSGDAFVAKYTDDGILSWNNTLGGVGEECGYSLYQTSDGGYIIAGYTNSYGAGSSDALTAKYTADGTLSWSKTWGGSSTERSYTLAQTSDGGYAIAGNTNSYGAGDIDAFIVEYTADGTLSWNKTWGGMDFDGALSLSRSNDNGYVIAGITDSYGAGNKDGFIAKYANDGNLLWSRTWGGAAYDGLYSLIQSADGGYIATGQTMSYGPMDYDGFLVKFDQSGYISNCPAQICQSPSVTVTNPAATVASPIPTVTNPAATVTNPSVSESSPSATMTDPIAIETTAKPAMTVSFSSQELYVAYPGVSKNICKQWTVPNGKQIKGFKVSQATEANYDFFRVYLDNVIKYNMSGIITDKYIDTSATPGTVLKACLYTDEGAQDGYGGEVTGVIYN